MGTEIERKFLVRRELWASSGRSTLFQQGYLCREEGRTVRARRAGGSAFLTIKGAARGLARPEFEYEVPLADIDGLLQLCIQPLIEKRRHLHEHEGHTWEVDEFLGQNAGLLVAEIELDRADEEFSRPSWVGEEVTDDPRYLNANLAVHPFSMWGKR